MMTTLRSGVAPSLPRRVEAILGSVPDCLLQDRLPSPRGTLDGSPPMVTYVALLDGDLEWALREGSMHFEENNAVHKALRKIAARLEGLGIPYAVVGGMAMFFHGYRRFTEAVDLLVTPEGLQDIHRRLEGLGYVPT